MSYVGGLKQCLFFVFGNVGTEKRERLGGQCVLILKVFLMDTCLFSSALLSVDFRLEREGVPRIGTIKTSVEL